MRKLTFISVVLVVSAILVLPSFSVMADEGVPWFGLLPYLLTGGPPSGEPKAVFSADPTSGQVPLTVDFDASSSADPDGSIKTYEWDFDDGNSGTGEQVTHTYDAAGNYTPELTVTDDDGKTDSYSDLTISVTSTNESPNASFTANPTSGEASLDVTFDASGSNDPDGSINSYEWNFDVGSTESGESVNYTFDNAGDYTVELTVTDDDGATDSITTQIEVSSAVPTDIYVDAKNGSDQNGDGSASNPYKTITKAVKVAGGSSDHNTIHVSEGVYNSALGEQFPLTIENMDIIGDIDDLDAVRISGETEFHQALIKGIHFYRTVTIWHSEFVSNKLTDTDFNGLLVYNSTIKNSVFKNNVWTLRTRLREGETIKILQNDFHNNLYAIDTEVGKKEKLVVTGNTIGPSSSGAGAGIYVPDSEGNLIVRDNVIESKIEMEGNGKALIESNTITKKIQLRESITIDLGGGGLGSLGNNVLQGSLIMEDLRAGFSGIMYAKNNTWKDSSGNKFQPPNILEGPADTEHFYIKNKGNKIIFSEQ